MKKNKQGHWLTRAVVKKLSKNAADAENRGHLCDFGRICHEVIPGDVLLMEGKSQVSSLIKRVTHSCWTHASLYIGRLHAIQDPEIRQKVAEFHTGDPTQQLLLETWPGQGTVINPLSQYHEEHIRICRPVGISFEDTQRVINYAVSHLGGEYDFRHFLDLGRFLLASHWMPKKWRSSLFSSRKNSQTTKDICSALIAEAFVSVDFPILPLIMEEKSGKMVMIHRNPRLFKPSDFDYSPYFNIIKYPILPGHQAGRYHNYPWSEDLVSHDDFVSERKQDNQ